MRRAAKKVNKLKPCRVIKLKDHFAAAFNEANQLHRSLNGLDITAAEERAEFVMITMLDGLSIGPSNRGIVKDYLTKHFADLMLNKPAE